MNLEELVAKDLAARSGFAVKENTTETEEKPVEEQLKANQVFGQKWRMEGNR